METKSDSQGQTVLLLYLGDLVAGVLNVGGTYMVYRRCEVLGSAGL